MRNTFYLTGNKRGDIPITILVIGVILVCGVALFSFFFSTIQMRNNFSGIGMVEQLDSQIEENAFYGTSPGVLSGNINTAINFAKNNRVGNRICDCGNSCNDYATWLSQAASENGIPDPILLLSLMMQESDCTLNAFSGSSVGLMQINLANCGNYGLPSNQDDCKKQLLENPQLNIEVGAKILKEKYDAYKNGKVFNGCSNRGITYTEWDAALRGYNGWGCGYDSSGNPITSQDSYVEEVDQRYDALKNVGSYLESDRTVGILWWAKKSLSFSVEYKGSP